MGIDTLKNKFLHTKPRLVSSNPLFEQQNASRLNRTGSTPGPLGRQVEVTQQVVQERATRKRFTFSSLFDTKSRASEARIFAKKDKRLLKQPRKSKRGSSLLSVVSSIDGKRISKEKSTPQPAPEPVEKDEAEELQREFVKKIAAKGVELLRSQASLLNVNEDEPTEEDTSILAGCIGKKKPSIPLDAYMQRLVKYVNIWMNEDAGLESSGVRSLVVSLVYLDRILISNPNFKITEMNIHRLLMGVCLIAVKFFEDEPISNRFWSQVGGVSLAETNVIEGQICNALSFNLNVPQHELEAYYLSIDEA